MRRIGGEVAGSIRRWIGSQPPMGSTESIATESATFGPYRLDLRTGELWCADHRVLVQRQPGLLLVLLVTRPGQLVTREEIRAQLWADRHVEVDAGINYGIRQIRTAIGERASSPVYLETLRGRGYRFVGAVVSQPAPTNGVDRTSLFVKRRRRILATVSLVAALLALVKVTQRRDSMAALSSAEPVTLAIVPFQNLTDNASCAWIVQQIAQGVRSVLGNAHAAEVRVVADRRRVPVDSAFTGAGDESHPSTPTFLLTGAISSTGHGEQVTVQVVRSGSGAVVATYSFASEVAFRRPPVIVDSLLPALLRVDRRRS